MKSGKFNVFVLVLSFSLVGLATNANAQYPCAKGVEASIIETLGDTEFVRSLDFTCQLDVLKRSVENPEIAEILKAKLPLIMEEIIGMVEELYPEGAPRIIFDNWNQPGTFFPFTVSDDGIQIATLNTWVGTDLERTRNQLDNILNDRLCDQLRLAHNNYLASLTPGKKTTLAEQGYYGGNSFSTIR